jgi:hypothetical protein
VLGPDALLMECTQAVRARNRQRVHLAMHAARQATASGGLQAASPQAATKQRSVPWISLSLLSMRPRRT